MVYRRHGTAHAFVDGKIFMFGGEQGVNRLTDIVILDPVLDVNVTANPTSLSIAMSGTQAMVFKKRVLSETTGNANEPVKTFNK